MDTLGKAERSALMAKVRSRGGKSTEKRVEAALTAQGLCGWVEHPQGIPGKPDFYFPRYRLALFVDGCFWHACPRCGRLPKSRVEFWRNKIADNWRRDKRIRRALRRRGYHVMRIWEHEAGQDSWVGRLRAMIGRIEKTGAPADSN
jgi:DNA mismatch endonuclease (patch repair protein)